MNRRELEVKKKYEDEGWKVLRNGAPDFVMLKVENNKIIEIEAVEVKCPNGKLSYEQKVWKEICNKAKIKYKIEVIK